MTEAILKAIDAPKSNVYVFSSASSAESFYSRGGVGNRLLKGNGEFVVTAPKFAERLTKHGYSYVNRDNRARDSESAGEAATSQAINDARILEG